MASVSLGVGAASTDNLSTYATGSFTPAAGDLLLALAGCPATVDAGAYTSSDAGKTYAAATSAVWATGANTFYAFVGEQAADADAQTGTMDVTGDAAAGCAQAILRISGMSKFGATGIRQFKVASNQAPDTTPTITFDAACLTGNPTVLAISGSSTGTPTAPDGWSLITSQTFATPTTGMKIWARDSGFTGDTITAGGTYGAGYSLIAIELDASSDSRTGTMAATEAGADDATAAGDVVVAGTLAVSETGTDAFAGTGTATQPEGAQPAPALTYGAGRFPKDYEARVRAHYEQIEQEQQARDERLRELQKQQAKLEERKKTESRKSALAKRRAKIAREIEAIEAAKQEAQEQIDALMAEIESFISEQAMLLDRRRRMVLLLAAAA